MNFAHGAQKKEVTVATTEDVTSFAVNSPAFVTAAARCLGSLGCQAAVARGAGRSPKLVGHWTPEDLKMTSLTPETDRKSYTVIPHTTEDFIYYKVIYWGLDM